MLRILFSTFIVLGTVGSLYANEKTFLATRDTTLFESPTGDLSNGAGDYLFAGTTGQSTNNRRRTLVAFDDAVFANLSAVELTLHVSKASSSAGHEFGVHRILKDWTEGTVNAAGGEGGGAAAVSGDATWLHASFDNDHWEQLGGDFLAVASDTITINGNGQYTWGTNGALVDDVRYWLENPSENFGWAIVGGESTNRTAKRFDSRTAMVEANRPSLTVSYVLPEPAGHVWAVLFVIVPLLSRRANRQLKRA